MDLLAAFAAAGVWVAVPVTGDLLATRARGTPKPTAPLPVRIALTVVAGLAVWSAVLLLAAIIGQFRPTAIGALGWATTIVGGVAVWRRSSAAHAPRYAWLKPARTADPNTGPALGANGPPVDAWDGLVLGGLLVAAVLYLAFPTESIYGARDEGVYANHAIHLAQRGRLGVPYPWPSDAHAIFAPNWVRYPGFFKTEPTMTVQFGHLFPLWLAQAYATGGSAALFRLNAVFALVALGSFYGVCRLALPGAVAAGATLLLAFNPSQLWMARITLSEVVAQMFVWAGLLWLLRGLRDGTRNEALCAGLVFTLAAFVRFDSLLLLPTLLLAHAAWRIVRAPDTERSSVWPALYQTALPGFALALGYYAVFNTPYFTQRVYLDKLALASVGAGIAVAASVPAVAARLRPLLVSRPVVWSAAVLWAALAVYVYWIRSIPNAAPQWQQAWPGYLRDATRDYSRDAIVNIGRYVTPPVVWAGLAGWFVGLWRVLRTRGCVDLLLPLVVILGFSAAHLTSLPGEDHFWIIRRFIPVVIPGLVWCAALAVQWAAERVPPLWARAGGVLVTVGLAAFLARADALIIAFAEDAGYFAQLERLAKQVPPDEVVLANGFTEWVTPLYVSFDRRVVPLNLDPAGKGRIALRAWVERQAAQGKPTYLLVEGGTDLSGYVARPLYETTLTRVYTEPTIDPLPKKLVTKQRRVRLLEVRPAG